MKIHKTILVAVAICLFAFSFTSCSDDDENNEPVYLPSKIINEYGTAEFTYDSQKRLIKSEGFYNNRMTAKEIITYNSKGQIEKIVHDDTFFYNVTYNNKTVTITPNRNDFDRDVYTCELTLDDKGRIIKEIRFRDRENYISEFEYDEVGNIKRIDIEYSHHGYKLYHDICTYDNMNGIFKNDKTPQWYRIWNRQYDAFMYNVNNQINYKEYNNLSGKLTEEYNQTYTYNEDGYPIQFIDDNENITTIEYIKR